MAIIGLRKVDHHVSPTTLQKKGFRSLRAFNPEWVTLGSNLLSLPIWLPGSHTLLVFTELHQYFLLELLSNKNMAIALLSLTEL